MKRILKIAKWTGLILLTLLAGLSLTIASRQNLHYDAPYPDIHASTDSAVIARGKHLVYSSAHCIDCHQRANADSLIALGQEVPLSGGVLFDLLAQAIDVRFERVGCYARIVSPDLVKQHVA